MWPFRRTKAVVNEFALKNASFLYGIGAARWLERRFDILAKEGYEQNPIVYACVSKLARASASVDLQLYRQKRGKVVKIDDHPILTLLDHPNPTQGGRKFREMFATYKLIGGNAFILGQGANALKKGKPPAELWVMPTQKMTVQTQTRSFLPACYEYKPGMLDAIRYPVNQINGLSEILHLKTVNPLNPSVGLPPLVAASFGVDTFNSGQAWNKALLDNEARPSGALEVVDGDGKPASLTEEQRSSLKSELESGYSGSARAGRPLILEGGLKWTAMSLSPKDMDHRETMLTTARFIAGVYHTPPQLVNIPGESTYSNYAEAKVAYYSDTVLPFLESTLEDINNWLPALFGEDDLYLWYDEEQIAALEPRRKEKADRINASNYLTIDEKRQAMGYDSYKPSKDPGGVLLVPTSDIPLEMAGDMGLAEPGSPELGGQTQERVN